MKRSVSYLRKLVAALVGVPVFIVGLILIPLPGPGILVCFAGLFILSLEFDWAKPHMERFKAQLKRMIDTVKASQKR